MKLTVKDVSKMLGVSEKTVYRWIGDRGLPGYRVSGQYRFNRTEVIDWSTANRVNVAPTALQAEEEEDAHLPSLDEALRSGGISYRVAGRDVESALRSSVDVLRLPEELDRDYLFQMVLGRELMGSTAVGKGIAVPHSRNPVAHLSTPTVSICFLETPVDFGALDGEPVEVLFLLLSPTVKAHLHLLSRVASALQDKKFAKALQEQAGRDALLLHTERLERQFQSAANKTSAS